MTKPINKTKQSEKTQTPKRPRRLKTPVYRSFRLQKRISPASPKKLPSVYRLFLSSLQPLRRHWRVFGGLLFICGVLYVILVRGLGNAVNINELKLNLDQAFGGNLNALTSSLAIFGLLLASSGNAPSEAASIYQGNLLLIMSLALIWALREARAKSVVRIRDAFYLSTYPLIPFLLVLMVIGLQLLPFMLGGAMYGAVVNGGIAYTGVEKAFWLLLFGLLAVLSLYMITSSVFALYIVTLPDMTPLKALRSARELVLHRRLLIVRKLLGLPLILLLLSAVVVVPFIIWLPILAQWVLLTMGLVNLLITHSYLYTLYRELL